MPASPAGSPPSPAQERGAEPGAQKAGVAWGEAAPKTQAPPKQSELGRPPPLQRRQPVNTAFSCKRLFWSVLITLSISVCFISVLNTWINTVYIIQRQSEAGDRELQGDFGPRDGDLEPSGRAERPTVGSTSSDATPGPPCWEWKRLVENGVSTHHSEGGFPLS